MDNDKTNIVYIDSEAGPAVCLRCGLQADRVTPGYDDEHEEPVEGLEECARCGGLGKPRIYRWE
jgi:NAD-dependent SIR2 family protein deacetylase